MSYLEKLKTILSPDQYKKVTDDLGEGKTLFVNDGKNFITIEKFNTKNKELETANSQITDLKKNISDTDDKLKEFSKLKDTSEEMKTKITGLTDANKQLVTDSDKKLTDANAANEKKLIATVIDAKVDVGLIKYGATSEASKKSVKANLDMEKIIHKDGEVTGLDDQLKDLHKNSSALFFGDKEVKKETKKEAIGTKFFKGDITEDSDLNKSPEERLEGSLYKDNKEED